IGSTQSVVLKAQQNIIDVMTYTVTGQTLQVGVKDNTSIENHEEIRFDITISSISNIDLVGVGDFVFSGADQDELAINLTGVGNVNAYDMKVRTCTINSTGVGDCKVHVLNTLTVTITGVGSIYYKGNPTITSSITGVGQLVDAN
ncbi:GIN domain-containing protein, partial [Bacteroidota bacterium]